MPLLIIAGLMGIYTQRDDGQWLSQWLVATLIIVAVYVVVYGSIFWAASVVKGRQQVEEPRRQQPATIPERLATVDQLRAAGHISDVEWQQQRQAILHDI